MAHNARSGKFLALVNDHHIDAKKDGEHRRTSWEIHSSISTAPTPRLFPGTLPVFAHGIAHGKRESWLASPDMLSSSQKRQRVERKRHWKIVDMLERNGRFSSHSV